MKLNHQSPVIELFFVSKGGSDKCSIHKIIAMSREEGMNKYQRKYSNVVFS